MTDLQRKVEETKQAVQHGRDDLLRTFSFVPDDKLTWQPSETARSAIWLVGHCGGANMAFAAFLRGETLPFEGDAAAASEMIRNTGRDMTSREEAVRLVEESSAVLVSSLDSVTEERMGTTTQTPFGPLPYSLWLLAAATHMHAHARQIDYLQTIWGDLQDHMQM